jgi:hypothetical protein
MFEIVRKSFQNLNAGKLEKPKNRRQVHNKIIKINSRNVD